MRTEYFFLFTYVTTLIFSIATIAEWKFLLAFSFVLILIIDALLGAYFLKTLLAHYGIKINGVPEEAKELTEEDLDIMDSMFSNPLKPQIFNVGLFAIFAISMVHLGTAIATASFIMIGLYLITFQSNKMLLDKMRDLTL